MSAILNPGKSARKAAEAAAASAAKSRAVQAVANDRQLSQLQSDSERTKSSRRVPRGRKLFADEGGKTNLS